MPGDDPTPEHRHVRLFRHGGNQAVRIPVEFELPGDQAVMHRDGGRLTIEPVRKRGLAALLKTMKPLEEGFPEVVDHMLRLQNARPQSRGLRRRLQFLLCFGAIAIVARGEPPSGGLRKTIPPMA
jgi:antitoxin VapB